MEVCEVIILIENGNELKEDLQIDKHSLYEKYGDRARQLKRVRSKDQIHFTYTSEYTKELDRRKYFESNAS